MYLFRSQLTTYKTDKKIVLKCLQYSSPGNTVHLQPWKYVKHNFVPKMSILLHLASFISCFFETLVRLYYSTHPFDKMKTEWLGFQLMVITNLHTLTRSAPKQWCDVFSFANFNFYSSVFPLMSKHEREQGVDRRADPNPNPRINLSVRPSVTKRPRLTHYPIQSND